MHIYICTLLDGQYDKIILSKISAYRLLESRLYQNDRISYVCPTTFAFAFRYIRSIVQRLILNAHQALCDVSGSVEDVTSSVNLTFD